MRLFTAIELPEEVRKLLCGWRDGLIARTGYDFRDLKWVARENLHITLKFLGDVPEQRVPELCDALKCATQVDSSMFLGPDRVLCFPKRGAIATIAIGFSGDLDALSDLYSHVEQACAELGFPAERRPYTAHATLARARPPLPGHARDAFQLTASQSLKAKPFAVREFVLMESKLHRSGPTYIVSARFPLRENSVIENPSCA